MEFSVLAALIAGLVGVVFMPMMPVMHPRMSGDPQPAGTVDTTAGQVRLAAPGLLGAR